MTPILGRSLYLASARASGLTASAMRSTQTRGFIAPSVIRSKDIIQDLYIKELKSYKPKPEVANQEKGQVKDFVAPVIPTAPVVDTSGVAAELAAYDVEEDVSALENEGLQLPEEDFESEESESSAH